MPIKGKGNTGVQIISIGRAFDPHSGPQTEITYQGLFAGITLNGAWVRSDADSTRAMYGDNVSYKSVLTGKVPAPPAASAFLQEVRGAKRQAAIEQRKKE